MPKVSVIIPVYNSEKYLHRCLDSVIGQTLQDIEIICINDASTDNSLDILNNYKIKDARIKIFNLQKNIGPGATRNIGILNSTGEYIGFVDSDDYITNEFYELLYKTSLDNNSDISKGIIIRKASDNKIIPDSFYDINKKIKIHKAYFLYGFTSAIFKRTLIQNKISFPDKIRDFEDPVFTIHASILSNNITLNDNAFYIYTINKNSLTSDQYTYNSSLSYKFSYKNILDILDNYKVSDKHRFIVVKFLIEMLLTNTLNQKFSLSTDKIVKNDIEILLKLFEDKKYSKHYLYNYIYEKIKTTHLKKVKLNNYKKELYRNHAISCRYRILGSNHINLLYQKSDINKYECKLKILVSYIKRAYLFSNSIFTPIHLGGSIAKHPSKDGVISDKDLNWLYENMSGDDSFPDNISRFNRRVGFLTGTYWAWKNYDILGNPQYFGSFGYRRLLSPDFLNKISEYDLILPNKISWKLQGITNIEQYQQSKHNNNVLLLTSDAMHTLYGNTESEKFNYYLTKHECYLYEIYIMKKNIFFDFCNWIFPILFYLIKNSDQPSYRNIYQIRDIGFCMERVTGYYLYTRKKIYKHIEYPVITL